MQTYLAIFTATDASRARSGWGALSQGEIAQKRAAGIAAWNDWVQRNAAALVDGGAPIGKTKRAAASGIADSANAITAYCIVRAESHEAAARLFERHPHFTHFPGEAVEIMPILPVPGAA